MFKGIGNLLKDDDWYNEKDLESLLNHNKIIMDDLIKLSWMVTGDCKDILVDLNGLMKSINKKLEKEFPPYLITHKKELIPLVKKVREMITDDNNICPNTDLLEDDKTRELSIFYTQEIKTLASTCRTIYKEYSRRNGMVVDLVLVSYLDKLYRTIILAVDNVRHSI